MPLLVDTLIDGPQEAVFGTILTLGQMAVPVNHLPHVLTVPTAKVLFGCPDVADYLLDPLGNLLNFKVMRTVRIGAVLDNGRSGHLPLLD
jgi:hypothetical protein